MIDIQKAIDILNNGGVIGMPTETVYGLAGDIYNETSIKKIFSTKERPFFDPLIVHVSDVSMAKPLVKDWKEIHQKLADEFWPGPLTMVIEKSSLINEMITSGLDSVGIRCPNHPIALKLISTFNKPLAAPSANKFTKTSPTTKEHVDQEFGDNVFTIDGGACQIGIESTVIGIKSKMIEIYRPGMITKEQIENYLDKIQLPFQVQYKESPVAPGQLKHHYMPKKPVVLCKTLPQNENNFWIVPEDSTLAARELYSQLRLLDENKNCDKIYIVLKEKFLLDDKFKGILNRLEKAKTIDQFFVTSI